MFNVTGPSKSTTCPSLKWSRTVTAPRKIFFFFFYEISFFFPPDPQSAYMPFYCYKQFLKEIIIIFPPVSTTTIKLQTKKFLTFLSFRS